MRPLTRSGRLMPSGGGGGAGHGSGQRGGGNRRSRGGHLLSLPRRVAPSLASRYGQFLLGDLLANESGSERPRVSSEMPVLEPLPPHRVGSGIGFFCRHVRHRRRANHIDRRCAKSKSVYRRSPSPAAGEEASGAVQGGVARGIAMPAADDLRRVLRRAGWRPRAILRGFWVRLRAAWRGE